MKKTLIILVIIIFVTLVCTVSCKKDPTSSNDPTTVTDFDGNVYKTVQIGEQLWMAENLKVTHYRNGDQIPNISDNNVWENMDDGAYCSYNNTDSNIDIYGLLYNWYVVDDSRGLAPTGWHIPTDGEWKQLEMYLGMSQSEADSTDWRGTDEGGKLKEAGTTHWSSPNEGASNESGFSALPGGFRDEDGFFFLISYGGNWWSSTKFGNFLAWDRSLHYKHSDIYLYGSDKQYGLSVRCIND